MLGGSDVKMVTFPAHEKPGTVSQRSRPCMVSDEVEGGSQPLNHDFYLSA